MVLLSLGTDTLIRLMRCHDGPDTHDHQEPDLSWLLYGPETTLVTSAPEANISHFPLFLQLPR